MHSRVHIQHDGGDILKIVAAELKFFEVCTKRGIQVTSCGGA